MIRKRFDVNILRLINYSDGDVINRVKVVFFVGMVFVIFNRIDNGLENIWNFVFK